MRLPAQDAVTKAYEDHITYFTMFDFEGTAFHRVTNTVGKDIFDTRIRPAADAETLGVTGRKEIIKLTKPCQLSYEVDGDIYQNLHIFANPPDMTDLSDPSIDILEVHSTYYTGMICFQCGGENIIRNVTFENFRIDDFTLSDLVQMHFIKDNNSYGYSISHIVFRDFFYTDAEPKAIILKGLDANRKISDITFENLVINGERATKESVNLIINSYVEHVSFR